MSKFTGTRILIVGGTSGVGLAAAQAFDGAGAVVTIASRSTDKIESALKLLGASAEGHALDIRDNDAVQQFATASGVFDHVVISAAETPMGRMDTLPLDEAYAAMDSKFWGPIGWPARSQSPSADR